MSYQSDFERISGALDSLLHCHGIGYIDFALILAIKIPLSFGEDNEFQKSFFVLFHIFHGPSLFSLLVSALYRQLPRFPGYNPRTSLPEIVLDDIDVINYDLCFSAELLEFVLL